VGDHEAPGRGVAAEDKRELINVLIDVWKRLKMALINALVDSMTRHLALVIKKAGERIAY
jgi:hypothetical protein